MDQLTENSLDVIEFKAQPRLENQQKLVDNCTGTDPPAASKDATSNTNTNVAKETQTQQIFSTSIPYDEDKLARWLRRIYPAVLEELEAGPTPLNENATSSLSSITQDLNIQIYQKLSLQCAENSQGLATWLSVCTNNAPVLVLTTVEAHDDWCEHINQNMKIFMPKRMQNGDFVVFTEVKSVPIKACLKVLSTNAYNKNIFSGSTMDGDMYVWQYEQGPNNNVEVKELFHVTSDHGYALAMDWATENRLLSVHPKGWVILWLINKEMLKEEQYIIKPPNNLSNEITTIISLNVNDFVVGTDDGGVYHCYSSSVGVVKKQLEIAPMKKHLFMVTSLLKNKINGDLTIISCDLSGQVYYQNMRNGDDDSTNVVVQIPLPFKNAIACSSNGDMIYSPGNDGSLECYRIRDGVHAIVKGALHGKGNLIKRSDNGRWIVTGLYKDEFQIFYLDK